LSVAYGSHVLRSSDTFETDESREALVERLEGAAAEHAYKVRVIRKENADYVAVSRPWRPPRLFWAAVLACALALVALAFVIGWFFWLVLGLLFLVVLGLTLTRTEATTYFISPRPDQQGCTVTAKRNLARPLATPLIDAGSMKR
jgi:hypothetical protein